jgi:hypothetical protein
MIRAALGITAATLAVYIRGFVFWGVPGLPYGAWKQVDDEIKVGQVLKEYFPGVDVSLFLILGLVMSAFTAPDGEVE